MKLGLFSMPLHPAERNYTQTMREDREAAVLADQLGFSEVYFGEHATDPLERVTSTLMFLSSLIDSTKSIKLGTGSINLPNGHPAQFASQIAMLDHMLEGRLILGISPGALTTDAEIFGNFGQNRGEMFLECIDQILEIWKTDSPYNIQGKYWNISTKNSHDDELSLGAMPRPFQIPHPPIVVAALAPNSIGVQKAAERGWHPMSSNFLQPIGLQAHWDGYLKGRTQLNLSQADLNWRVARMIFVSDDEATAHRYAKTEEGPYAFMVNSIYKKLHKAKRLESIKIDMQQPNHEITPEFALESLVIAGTVNSVVEQILELAENTGEIGTLLYVNADWMSPQLAKRSMALMANEVMPRVNSALYS